MPAYNCEKYIGAAVTSVLHQDFTDWELIVSDNGSADGTVGAVHAASGGDGRVTVIDSSAVRSAAAARRAAIDAARGEWVAFLDSDDEWTVDKLSKALLAAEEKDSSFVFTGSAFIDDEGRKSGYVLHVPERVSYPGILKQNVISCSSVLIKRELLDGCFTETDNSTAEDYVAWIRILRDRGITALGVDEPLLRYRITSASLSSNKLKAAVRTFRSYRRAGLPFFTAVRFWLTYVYRSLKKYKGINNG